MGFLTDDQTLKDLNLLGKFRSDSIFSLFNKVKTRNGEKLLEVWFSEPMSDPIQINKRAALFRFFQEHPVGFVWEADLMEVVENYLAGAGSNSFPAACIATVFKKAEALFIGTNQYDLLCGGITATIKMLSALQEFILLIQGNGASYAAMADDLPIIVNLLADNRIATLAGVKGSAAFPVFRVAIYDYWIRNTLRPQIKQVLDFVYRMDIAISVSDIARERGFSYATAYPPHENVFKVSGLYHPGIHRAIGNPLFFKPGSNVMFLTGANMAGKSTFMKSVGIALYLGHMGFPVATGQMAFSVKSGLYTSINLSDNLQNGLSHFYAEVLRVKKVAQEVVTTKNIVVIFDELFKGTNVKDAFDATLEVTKAFARYHHCFFLVSTHIIEVGEQLNNQPNIQFAYLPTYMENHVPKYTYQLQPGISQDRQGMNIINKEDILQLLGSIK